MSVLSANETCIQATSIADREREGGGGREGTTKGKREGDEEAVPTW